MHFSWNKLPHSIDDNEGGNRKAEIWKNIFQSRFNCVDGSGSSIYENLHTDDSQLVTSEEVCILNARLGPNKSCGADNTPAEVYKHGTETLFRITALLFNMMPTSSFFAN